MSIFSKITETVTREMRLRDEISRIGPAELAALGLTRADLSDIAHMPAEQVERMRTMAAVHGADDALRGSPVLQAEVSRTCAQCRANDTCRTALMEGVSAEDCGFCPNHDTFTDLARG